jgi:Zn-dependent protease
MTRKMVALPGKDVTWADVYEHPGGTHAWVERSDAPEYGEPATVSYLTGFADGTNHLTLNRYGHHIVDLPGDWQVHDDYLPDRERAFDAHQRRIQYCGKAIERDGIALRDRFLALAKRMVANLARTGWIAPAGEPGRYRFTWTGALRLVIRYLRGSARAARNRPKPSATHAAHAADAQPQALDRNYDQVKTLQWSKADRRWLSGLSIVAFAVVGVWLWGWDFMVILLVVIGVHEAGHYLAMRVVGYRDLNVFFLPGLGGIATGRKADATPFQKVFVYLAGPMPGIVTAVVLLVAFADAGGEPAWVIPLVVVTLFINYLNLLPVTPLDGGRVVEILLFAKVPVMRLAFVSTCAIALLAVGLWTGDAIFAIFGGLLALGLPHQWRVYSVERLLPTHKEALDESRAKELVFAACSRPEFAKWSFDDRSAVAIGLVDEMQSRKPRLVETVAGLAVYATCLAGPAYALIEHSELGQTAHWMATLAIESASEQAPQEPGPPVPPPRDWDAEIARSASLPPRERLALLLDAMDHDHWDPAGPAAMVDKAWALAKDLPADDPLQGRALLAKANQEDKAEVRAALVRQVAAQFDAAVGRNRLVLADALEQLYWIDAGKDAEGSLRLLERAAAIRAEELAPGDRQLQHTNSELARRWFVAGRRDEAGALLERSARAMASAKWDERVFVESDFAGYLTAAGRAPEAEAQLAAFIGQMPTGGISRFAAGPARQRLLWSQLAQRGPEAASRAHAALLATREDMARGGGKAILRRNLQHQLAELAVARALGDARDEKAAVGAIREGFDRKRPDGSSPCTHLAPAAPLEHPWERTRLDTQARLLAELGFCPAGASAGKA